MKEFICGKIAAFLLGVCSLCFFLSYFVTETYEKEVSGSLQTVSYCEQFLSLVIFVNNVGREHARSLC